MAKRLGIFGDSFCSLNSGIEGSWPNVVSKFSGFDITNFGKPGTGIMWSYRNLLDNADQYDWNIWCVSSIQRLALNVPVAPWVVHYTPGGENNHRSPAIVDICKTVDEFFVKVDIYSDLNILYDNLIMAALSKWSNLLVIPCFHEPLMRDCYLNSISEKEVQCMKNVHGSYSFRNFRDRRPCHLTPANNKILAQTILEQKDQKILSIDLDKFIFDNTLEFDNYFYKL